MRAVGGAFEGTALARAFTAAMLERLPDADLRIGEAHPLDGAQTLAVVAPTSALAAHIASASA